VAYGRALDSGRRTFAPSGPSGFRTYGHAPELRRIRPGVDREAKEREEGIVALLMMQNTITMRRNKNIALVAHDNKKEDLFEWAKFNCRFLAEHSLYATSATGQLLKSRLGLNVTQLESGLLGGDQQIGSRISEGQIDFVIFFSDPLEPQPHDDDVKALLRIAVVWNIPVARNRASADFIISSPLMSPVYERKVPDYSEYRALAVRGVEGHEFSSLDDLPRRACHENGVLSRCPAESAHGPTLEFETWTRKSQEPEDMPGSHEVIFTNPGGLAAKLIEAGRD